MEGLPLIADPNLVAGMEGNEDAGVYRLTDDLAVIQTVDFFTPIVDDPYTFGQIAVVNALSDVYAMGGKPLTAMNIVCFPVKTMDMDILRRILLGGLDKMREASVTLVGGHSVEDNELKYGLSVTGLIHPQKVLFNRGARAGDKLVLTKPLGTGIVNTAVKGGVAPANLVDIAINCMTTLNKKAAELMVETPDVHACTDVSGFGFLGHALEMVEGSTVGMTIDSTAIPYFPEIREFIETGIVPGGLYRNRSYRERLIEKAPDLPDWMVDVLFDPQTAGGLLIALTASRAEGLIETMHAAGIKDAAVIGEVTDRHPGKIHIY